MATVDEILAKLKKDMVDSLVKVAKVDVATITDDMLKAQIAKGWYLAGVEKFICVHCGSGVPCKDGKPRFPTCVGCEATLTV